MSSKEEMLSTLQEMGFDRDKASEALEKFPDNMEQAVEYLSSKNNGQNQEKPRIAKSWVCTDTGKKFRTLAAAQAYAKRTGNMNFEERDVEIPPLTEEEKKEKIAALRKRMEERRQERQNQEKIDNIAKEITRRREGQEMAEIREKMEKQRRLNQIELMKKEKKEQEEHRLKLREDIARDKGNRAAEKAEREGRDPNIAYKEAYDAYMKKHASKGKEKSSEEKLDQIVSAIEVLHDNKTTILQTLHKMMSNVMKNPSNAKFRKIKVKNPAFHERVGKFRSGIAFFKAVGFEIKTEDDIEYLILEEANINLSLLTTAVEKISAALGL